MSDWQSCGLYWDEFAEAGLNRPGTLVELDSGGLHLIGDVDPLRGTCGHCPGWPTNVVVRRYRVVWDDPGRDRYGRPLPEPNAVASEGNRG